MAPAPRRKPFSLDIFLASRPDFFRLPADAGRGGAGFANVWQKWGKFADHWQIGFLDFAKHWQKWGNFAKHWQKWISRFANVWQKSLDFAKHWQNLKSTTCGWGWGRRDRKIRSDRTILFGKSGLQGVCKAVAGGFQGHFTRFRFR